MKITTAVFVISALAGSSAVPLATVGADAAGRDLRSTRQQQVDVLVLTLDSGIQRDRLAIAVALNRLRSRCAGLNVLRIAYSEPRCAHLPRPSVLGKKTASNRTSRQSKLPERAHLRLASSMILGEKEPKFTYTLAYATLVGL